MKKFLFLTFIMCLIGGISSTSIMAQDVITIDGTVGAYTSSSSKYVPIYNNYEYSISQQYYLADEINKNEGGIIESISFKTFTDNIYPHTRTFDIYMINTDDYNFGVGGRKSVAMPANSLVYSGTVTFTQNTWVTIDLDTNFEYTGSNVLVCVNDKTGEYVKTGSKFATFDCNYTLPYEGDTGLAYRCVYKKSTSTAFNPSVSQSSCSTSKPVPYVQFTFSSGEYVKPASVITENNPSENLFYPSLTFNLENTTKYRVLLSTDNTFNSGVRYLAGSSSEFAVGNGTIQISNIAGLRYPATYYWKVIAHNGDATDDPVTEQVFSFTTANITVPSAISNIYPENGKDNVTNNPTLSWTFGEYTEQYQVWFGFDGEDLYLEQDWTYTNNAETASFGTDNIDLYKDQAYNENGLEANTTYNWKVVTKNAKGTTESEIFVFTKIGAPNDVTDIYPRENEQGIYNPTLTWTFASNTEQYRVLIGEGSSEQLAYCGAGTATTWLDVQGTTGSFSTSNLSYDLKPNTTYYWCVDVKNGAGSRGKYGCDETVAIHSFTTTDIFPAKYTTPANGQLLNATEATLFWNYGSGNTASEYQVLFGTDERSLDVVQDWTTVAGTNGSYLVTDLQINTKYYWQINTRRGRVTREGEVWSFYSKLGVPANIVATQQVYPGSNIESGYYTDMTWDSIPEALYYNVYVDGVKKTVIATENTYRVTGLRYNDGNAYEIQVSAIYNINDREVESDKSEAVAVRVAGYASISGKISNELSYEAIAEATVQYEGIDEFGNPAEYTFTTNAEGKFSCENILAGTYTMTVTKENYNPTVIEDLEYSYDEIYKSENADLYPIIPENVTVISPANGTSDQYMPELSWSFAENTTHYRVLMSEDIESLVYVAGSEWIEAEETASFQTSNLEANTTYYWCIDVRNANATPGERAFYGEYEDLKPEIFSFTTTDIYPAKYTTPGNGDLLSATEATLFWSYGTGNNTEQYQVLLGTNKESLSIIQDWATRSGSNGSYSATNLQNNTKYYWQVNTKKGSVVREGEIWSFVTTLDIPQNIVANPTNIYPVIEYTYKKGNTDLTWDNINGVYGYNVYVNGEQVNDIIITTSSYTVKGLGYNMEEGHNIQVTAVYDGLGESEKSVAANVKVTGFATISGTVTDKNGIAIEDASVTLYGIDEFEIEQEIAFNNTNEDGAFSGRVPAGEYNIVVSKSPYNNYISTLTSFEKESSNNYNISLAADNIFTVSFKNVSADQLHIYLSSDDWTTAKTGYYDVYFKQGDNIVSGPTQAWFSEVMQGATAVFNEMSFNDIWFNLENGTYQVGVASNGSDVINWTSIVRNYSIFITDGEWSNENNWRGVPGTDADVYIYAAATITAEDNVTVKNITVQNTGTLTINGSLTANKVSNEFGVSRLCINDGGQLRQTNNNEELRGKFVMNINNPTEWGNVRNGWQFISSPVIDAKISQFIPNENYFDYDLFKYDGTKTNAEWVNQKQTDEEIENEIPNDFETTFVQYRGYLASYEADPLGQMESKATFSGVLNNATSFEPIELAYFEGENQEFANFHLFGNPFTFNMNVESIIPKNIVTGCAVLNENGSGYRYLTSGEIKVGEGFFVKTVNENATISYQEGTLMTSRTQTPSINIIASNKTGSDNVIIRFAGEEIDGFNKLENFDKEMAEIYLSNKSKRYGIFSYDKNINEIAVYFKAKEMGYFTINAVTDGEFDNVILIDRVTGSETNLLTDSYSFTTLGNERSDRFIVKFSMNDDMNEENFVYQSGEELIINAEGTVQIIDMMGRIVYNMNVENTNHKIDVSGFNNSAYIVRVINENEIKTQKVVVY